MDTFGGPIVLSDAVAAEILEVNQRVNRSIRPEHKGVPTSLKRWEIAPRAGDCNDYAVTKRHELLKRGLPASALLLTAVETSWGEGHLVLTVRTDRGDYILDNLTSAVRPWTTTGYRWLRRQSAQDTSVWVSLERPRNEASAGRV